MRVPIELGGAPVLGWLLDAETLVDPCVLERDMVVFAAGTRTESVRVQTRDLFRGEHATFVRPAAEPESAEMSEPQTVASPNRSDGSSSVWTDRTAPCGP